jgi:hypothetical protein
MFWRLKRGFTRAFAPLPVPSGQYYSKLDVVAEAISGDRVDTFFHAPAAVRITAAMVRYFGDPKAQLALKKGYHVAYENRLRLVALDADPPSANGFEPFPLPKPRHPLDPWAARDLAANTETPVSVPTVGLGARTLHVAMAAGRSLVFLAEACAVQFHRAGRQAPPLRSAIATPNFQAPERWQPFLDAALSIGRWRRGNMTVVRLRDDIRMPPNGEFQTLNPARIAVPRYKWLVAVLLPAFRLVGVMVPLLLRHCGDARAVELVLEAIRQARHSVVIWRVGFNLECTVFIDNMEYHAHHAVRAMVLRKFSIRVVRWPHSEVDSPGAALRYLQYDAYLNAGPYPQRAFGDTWDKSCRAVAVGYPQHSRAMKKSFPVRPDYDRAIRSHLAADRKMLAYFGPSEVQGLKPFTRDLVAALLSLVERHDNWFIVIKPKLRDYFYDQIANDARLRNLATHPAVVCIRYPEPGIEVCPPGWLIENMTCGAGGPSSVQIEALTSDKPYFAYFPVAPDTAYKAKLRTQGLLHTDLVSFGGALGSFMDGQHIDIDFAWFRDMFDPYGDDAAMLRVAEHLFDGTSVFTSAPVGSRQPIYRSKKVAGWQQ